MQYTLVDAINKLKKIYDKETKDRNIINIEDTLKYENVKDVYDNIIEIASSNFDEFSNFISLLILDFSNIIFNDAKNNNNISNNQKKVLFHIMNSNKEEYIKYIYLEEISDLFIIISTIFEEYNFNCEFELEEYPYSYIEDIIKNEFVQKLYKEYHPNFELEKKKLKEYVDSNKRYEMFSNMKINGVFSFIYFFTVFKNNITDKYELISMFMSKLWEIYDTNEKLYKKIVYYLCGYFYAKNKNVKSNNHDVQALLASIEYNDDNNLANIVRLDLLLGEFISFDFLDFKKSLDKFPQNIKKKMMKM